VHDVRFGQGAPTVTTVAGLATGVGADVARLRLLPDGWSAPHGWSTQVALQVLGEKGLVDLVAPDSGLSRDPADAPEGMSLQGEGSLPELAVLGPWLGVHQLIYGYGGGAHDYHDEAWRLLRPPAKDAVDARPLFQDAAKAAQAAAARAKASVQDEPPEITAESLAGAALRVRGGQLELVDVLSCCSWAENHNLYELVQPVSPTPALAPYVPDAQGQYAGPKGCSLKIAGGDAFVRQGDGPARRVALAGPLVGLAWIEPGAPALAPWPADVKAAKAALALAGKASAEHGATRWALAQRAATLAPTDGAVLLEAGWLGFKAKAEGGAQQAQAQALTERALAHTDAKADPVQAAKALYNLGRFRETAGDIEQARAHYTRSLALRPHPVVKQRLADLPKGPAAE
ncbi:MAG: hypothetical protein KC613_22670, partial [Myxococcales bacterium]|nr:hypothetical protein [Myxococcales bacterium]